MRPETFYCIKNPNRSRDINLLRHEGASITDPDQIVATMQAWYERTAERALPQSETLTDFLARHHTDLPQIEEDQKEALEEEFSINEVQQAINEAHEVSAPGPSGHTIAFYKLLFLTMPNMMTRALNQLVFLPRLSEDGYNIEKSFTYPRSLHLPLPLIIGLLACLKCCTKSPLGSWLLG